MRGRRPSGFLRSERIDTCKVYSHENIENSTGTLQIMLVMKISRQLSMCLSGVAQSVHTSGPALPAIADDIVEPCTIGNTAIGRAEMEKERYRNSI